MGDSYNTIVIGAGQAGLAIGYYLKQKSLSFLIIDSNSRVGDSWRHRYDSLTLFTPRSHSALPGMNVEGSPHGYPIKDEIADYLENYSRHYNLPVQLNTAVINLFKENDQFHLVTNKGNYVAKNIVVATGPFQKPFVPDIEKDVSKDIFQIHAAHYKNPSQLKEGTTLIVGAGNSGVQIATELAESREIYLSVGKRMKFLPYTLLNRSIFWWFQALGVSKATIHSKLGQFMKKNDPIIGKELKPLLNRGAVKKVSKVSKADGKSLICQNGEKIQPENIIWATGYHNDYEWIEVPNIIDKNNNVIHDRGITKEKGLYFLGLSWQYRRGSALLLGVGEDAKFLANHIN
ncbi:flavin-containing monooxygenase [Priestia aryabhattai]|uniref:flavin-containing monooxygenase n=1 Tax=Priestia TaxID=2800373 RepID=UPI0008DD6134|nr:NAD(P)/FAD-dependent oxidoreductase [Priestia aryabhattai]MBX9966097.1 NAD(P)-binding domain-containing protein [Priestia aryabhattai]MDH3115217.1 NAD(P)/FAD-dependent oxidoreductase [Priestia aryabhattai]MDH3125890.1 NAD(P)/FAD-dependent oxidoreductase [Priestia aryabhattai]MDH3133894.1 NAD(P)/FAD-dependent oxidoreductase [Priestia aryabhattai]MED4156828.1 NAD(P)/FAD-dependent oxidoreductase [Priestia aryabhattai]